ncbi:hypothetical protein MM817_00221 [Acidibacillus sp. S0AB]|uniref:HTH arsR-type domain-containing protein n=1 Tax=Sulfoacidibacillus ferrooxidans TaxID=2005001 RepID=A0A9X1V704_9BACL|nr:hypothetical protein [Sulfoacidibacillus ferrooxidans]
MDWALIFKALGHSVRFQLYMSLLQGVEEMDCKAIGLDDAACCVVDFTRQFSLAQSTISHHLRILQDAGLITQKRSGTYSLYSVNAETLDAMKMFMATLHVYESDNHTHPVGVQGL